jgi:beta-aspartyl-peptidase (threonine type)
MLLIASANGSVGMDAGWRVLSSGGSALDAVEAATREVEDNPDDHSVGYSGYPNLLCTVELDASLMDGSTRRAGTVGAVHGYRHPITIARAVMERLPHVMVVGEGAAKLAAEIGMDAENLLTPEAESAWRDGVEGRIDKNDERYRLLSRVSSIFRDPEHIAGRVNFLAIDNSGHLASAVSTSGWAWKYPGRLGDSSVIGAGNYCDDRYGAAACTGWGELAIRGVTAHAVVSGLAADLSLESAAERAISDLRGLDVPGGEPIMHLIDIDPGGHHTAVSTRPGNSYVAWEEGHDTYVTLPRKVVSLSE